MMAKAMGMLPIFKRVEIMEDDCDNKDRIESPETRCRVSARVRRSFRFFLMKAFDGRISDSQVL